jgi:hypothetical protein
MIEQKFIAVFKEVEREKYKKKDGSNSTTTCRKKGRKNGKVKIKQDRERVRREETVKSIKKETRK